MKMLASAIAVLVITAAPIAHGAGPISDMVRELNAANLTGANAPFKVGTYSDIDVLGVQVLLSGVGQDGKPLTVVYENASDFATGGGWMGPSMRALGTEIGVMEWTAAGVVPNPAIPGKVGNCLPFPPVAGDCPASEQSKRAQAERVVPQPAPIACAAQQVIDRYQEYSYGIDWCSVTSKANVRRKNYNYMFANGTFALVLTLDYDCTTVADRDAMPPSVKGTC